MSRALIVAAGLMLGIALTGPAASGAQEDESGLLDRYRPILRYDAGEEYFAQPVSHEAERIDRDLIYARVAEADGVRWLQYWLFYAQNTQDRGLLRTGRHEGDWEFVQLRLDAAGMPETATFAQHSVAERCPYESLELREIGGAQVAVIYVANGSHASYPRGGTADRPWPDPNDEAAGSGREVRPALEQIGDSSPAWVADPRPWGSSTAGIVPGEQSSPPGPRFQSDGRWDDPGSYEKAARPCGSAPPGRPWQTPSLIGVGVVLLGGAVLWRRRRR
jgi:MYXO-CTERM domain-containing protein